MFTNTSGGDPLKFEDAHPEIQKQWPEKSLETWDVGNCADIKACNAALKSRENAKLGDLEGAAVNTRGQQPKPKQRCKNCQNTTSGADFKSDELDQ